MEYGCYRQIAVSLQHYNRIQTTYRTFTSTWLLATFFGIGYTLSSLEVNLPFHPLVITAFICLASATGVSLVWYMDLIICEQHIAALVVDGMELEKKHNWLPQFYHTVNKMSKLLGYVTLKGVFYVGCFVILFIAMGASLTIFLKTLGNKYYIAVPFIDLIVMGAISRYIFICMKRYDPYLCTGQKIS